MSEKDLKAFMAAFETAAVEVAYENDLPSGVMAQQSSAISLKRIADALDGQSPNGSVLHWLETIASAANAGRS